MATPIPRIKLPETAKAGEIIEIKTLISHQMESGQRKDKDGTPIPRKIINSFTCKFEDQLVFSCDIAPAIAANPFFEFSVRVTRSGTFKFAWGDDDGSFYTAEQAIAVT